MRLLGTIENKDENGNVKFVSEILEDADGRVFFTADADIDADGANGQNGAPPAYKVGNTGTDHLNNAGMMMHDGQVVLMPGEDGSGVILDAQGLPKVFPGGIIASKTWYQYPGVDGDLPEAWVDAETVPYIVVPPLIVTETEGVVRGCKARVTFSGHQIECVVADLGPRRKTGEISIAAARALGIPESPRIGGREEADVLYELWPGIAAPGFELQPA